MHKSVRCGGPAEAPTGPPSIGGDRGFPDPDHQLKFVFVFGLVSEWL